MVIGNDNQCEKVNITDSRGTVGFSNCNGDRLKSRQRATDDTVHTTGTEPTPARSTYEVELTFIQLATVTIADLPTTRQRGRRMSTKTPVMSLIRHNTNRWIDIGDVMVKTAEQTKLISDKPVELLESNVRRRERITRLAKSDCMPPPATKAFC